MFGLFRSRDDPAAAHGHALDLLKHAAVTRFRDTPAAEIKALDALDVWRDTFLDRPRGPTVVPLDPPPPPITAPSPAPPGGAVPEQREQRELVGSALAAGLARTAPQPGAP